MAISFFSVASSSSPRLRALICQHRIAAHHQALTRIIGRGDLGEIARVEQRKLNGARLDQAADRRRPQRRDPVEAGRFDGLLQARLGDHAAIADQHHAFEPEALLELGDLARQRRRIPDIAFEHFDRDRAAFGRAQKPEHDLQLAGFAVAIVAEPGERAGTPLEISRGDVIEHQRAVLEMASRQRFLNALLLCQQPIEHVIKRLLVDPSKPQNRAERTACRLAIEQTRRCQLGGRIDEARHHRGDAQRHLARRLPPALGENVVEPDLAQRAQRRRHVPVRQAAQQLQSRGLTATHHLVAQQPPQRFDLRRRPVRDVGQRTLLDLAVLAIGLAQQVGGRRGPVRYPINVHDSRESRRLHEVKKKMAITWVQTAPTHAIPIHSQSLARKTPGNFRLSERCRRCRRGVGSSPRCPAVH